MDFEDYQSKLSDEQLELLRSVEKGTLAKVKNLFDKYWDSDDDKGYKLYEFVLLVTALRRQHKSMIKFLVKKCPVGAQEKTGYFCSSFYYAVQMGDLDTFKLLWRQRGEASIFDKDNNNDTALELAMIERHDTIINFVLNDVTSLKSAEYFSPDCENDTALFHAACWTGNLKAIKIFLSNGFSLKSQSSFDRDHWKGFTSLHFALHRSINSESITYLLKQKDADIFALDIQNRTPLHLDFRNDIRYSLTSEIVVNLLTNSLSEKHVINPMDKNGLSIFHILCSMKMSGQKTKDLTNFISTQHLNLIKSFIDRQVNADSAVSLGDIQYPGFTALHFAVKESSWDVLEMLLQKGADPKKTDKDGLTPLHFICRKKKIEREQRLKITKLLLQYGADPIAKDSQNRTPLHSLFYAQLEGRPLAQSEMFLLSKNQSGFNQIDSYGISYLHIACTGDDLGIIKTLVAKGASINSRISKDSPRYAGYSALHIAVRFNKVEFVEYLLNHGASANERLKGARIRPLHLACDHTLDQLYETKIKNCKDNVAVDLLPSRTARIRIIELLIEKGASVDAKNSSGKTALLVNCHFPKSLLYREHDKDQEFLETILDELTTRQKMTMEILLLHGAKINTCDDNDRSILHILSKSYGKYAVGKELAEIALERGADVNAIDDISEHTPLHVAVDESINGERNTLMIDLLFKHGANVNAKTETTGDTPLHVALRHPSKKLKGVFTKLLDHSYVDVNAQNHRKQTPLYVAIRHRKYSCINELLAHGADINIVNRKRLPPTYNFLAYLRSTYDDPPLEEKDLKILIVIVMHVKKLLKLNLHVSIKVLKDFDALSGYLNKFELVSMNSNIDAEFECLKSQKLDNYTTFYDLLFKDSNSMAKHVLNSNLQKMIPSIHSRSRYLVFGDIIKRQYEKGFKRSQILEPAKKALNHVTDIRWPHSCADEILRYLSDENLNSLIDTVSDDSIHQKPSRNFIHSGESAMKIRRRE